MYIEHFDMNMAEATDDDSVIAEGDIVLSQSAVEKLLKCPAAYGQRHHEGNVRWPSEAITFGWFLHARIDAKLQGGFMPSTTDALYDLFNREVQRGYPEWTDRLHVLASATQQNRLTAEVDRAYEELPNVVPIDDLPVVAAEVRMYRPFATLDDSMVWLAGSPDLVTSSPSIYDWKSANRAWDIGRAQMRIQGPHYTWLSEGLTGTLDLPFFYCVWNRKDQQWEVHETKITTQHVEASLRTTLEWAKQVKANAYPANAAREEWGKNRRGWHCSPKWCDSWNICPLKGYLQDDDRPSLQAVREVPVSW